MCVCVWEKCILKKLYTYKLEYIKADSSYNKMLINIWIWN